MRFRDLSYVLWVVLDIIKTEGVGLFKQECSSNTFIGLQISSLNSAMQSLATSVVLGTNQENFWSNCTNKPSFTMHGKTCCSKTFLFHAVNKGRVPKKHIEKRTPCHLGLTPPPLLREWGHVTCHISHVTCHLSRVTCHMSHFFLFFYKVLELIGGGSVINGAYPSSLLNDWWFRYVCWIS